MQKKTKPLIIDIKTKGATDKLLPSSALLTSHDANWQNLVLEHHSHSSNEISNISSKQHFLFIALSETKDTIKINDRLMENTRRPGDIMLVPANSVYSAVSCQEKLEYIIISVEPQQLLDNNQEIIKVDSLELIPTFNEPDPFVYGMALSLHQELRNNHDGSCLYAESLLNSLNVHLLHRYANKTPLIKNFSGGLPPYKLKQAIEYINDNLDQKIKLDDVAQLLDISQFYFSHMFKESTGIAPYKYIIKQRLERAKQLIKQSKLPLADIALECGFTSQSQMTQHFRKCVGVTPKVYRNG